MAERQLTLRPETESDVEFLRALYAGTRFSEFAALPLEPRERWAIVDMQFRAQRRHYAEHYRNARYDIILVDDAAAGRLCVQESRDELLVVDIALLPVFRGAGLGTRIMHGLMERAAGERRTVRLHVTRSNPARKLYERLGFRPVSSHGVHDCMDWHHSRPPA